MRDEDKSREELVHELQEMRRWVRKRWGEEVSEQTCGTPGCPEGLTIEAESTQGRRSEDILHEGMATIEALLNATGDMVYLVDREGSIIVANHRGTEFLGGSHHKLIGASIFDFFPARLASERREKLDEVVRSGRPLIFEDKHYVSYFENSFYPILGGEGVQRIAIYSRDITDNKRAEKALKESKEKYKRLIEMMNEGLLVQDENGIISYVNDKLCEMLGCSAKEMVGHRVADFLDEPNLEKLGDRPDTTRPHGPPSCEIEWRGKDGRTVWTITSPSVLCDAEGVSLGGFAVITDITDRKRAEEELKKHQDHLEDLVRERTEELRSANEELLREIEERKKAEEAAHASESFLNSVIDQSPYAMWISDDRGTLIRANNALRELLHISDREVVGVYNILRDNIVEEQGLLPVVKSVFERGETVRFEIKYDSSQLKHIKLNRPTFVILDVTMFPVKDSGGRITNVVIQHMDITVQKSLQRQLLQSQKMEAIGTLAGGIAHDFNNLLTVVIGFSELLLAEKQEDDPDYADLRKMLHAAQSGAELVQRLLMYSRKLEPRPVSMNLNEKIVEVEKLLRRTIPRMVDISLDLSADLPVISADPSQIEQVLMNLALNARDAMPHGGKLTVRTSTVVLDKEYSRLHVGAIPGEYVFLEVSDTGHGMDREIVEHIFEPFFTTKAIGRGTGLGLAMVHGIVKQHNGYLTVQSEIGKGTAFRVYLPAIRRVVESDAETPGTLPTFGTETVLLVDDEELIRDLGTRILTKHGYTVLQATNGRDGLDLFNRERSRISLVILDLIMPEMGGTQCLKELLKINPNLKVLIASGYSADSSVKDAIRIGAKGFVTKPFRVKELLRDVRSALDEG